MEYLLMVGRADSSAQNPKMTKGSLNDMLGAFYDAISDVESATNSGNLGVAPAIVTAEEQAADVQEIDLESYLNQLTDMAAFQIVDEVDGVDFEYDDKYLYAIVQSGLDITEYRIPLGDLALDWDAIDDDVEYVVKEIL